LERAGGKARIRVEVQDTGIGMTTEDQAQLFQPFVQADSSTSRRFGGTGLGLSISRTLVELMGGQITVDSRSGSGSTFSFTIVLGDPDDEAAAGMAPAGGGGRRVLVAGTHGPTRRQLAGFLEEAGFRAAQLTGGDGVAAELAAAGRSDAPYAVLVLDHRPPEDDSLSLAAALRQDPAHREIRIIVVSSFTRRGDAARAREEGCCAHVTRPVRRQRFLECLHSALAPGRAARPRPLSAGGPKGAPPLDACVLVVDDNVVNQRVVARMLDRMGYRVETAANGLEAVEAVRRGGQDAVLMDCQMPELDGYAAARRIRGLGALGKRLPIIALTASALPGERQRCLEAGMSDFLTKPVRLEELAAVLGAWLSGDAARGGRGAHPDDELHRTSERSDQDQADRRAA
jgi:CheY-like chemotaxis protein